MTETTQGHSRGWPCGDYSRRDFPNILRILWRMAAWAVSFIAAGQLIRRDLLPSGPVAWVVAALPSVILLFVLTAYARFLREADEVQRSVQLNALALGFGGGWLAIPAFSLFEKLGAPDLDQGDAILVMAGLYSIGVVVGWMRYR